MSIDSQPESVGVSTALAPLTPDEKELLQSTALDMAADAVVITDVKGTILWVNPAFVALTGYTGEEAIASV
jgi:PAS domain-containing protein